MEIASRALATLASLVFISVLVGCGPEQIPSRDHMPLLQARLFELQVGVVERNRAVIDSLLSVDFLANNQNSDSLLSFVYGSDGDFEFVRFGLYEIYYTDKTARIDCYLMDSLSDTTRPITLTLLNQHDMWLLKKIGPRAEAVSFTDPDSASKDEK